LKWKRPYLIIDPRAGHGAGIGGFKADSQVGVALRDAHPVYFLVFRPHPEPNQTLADVMRAEAAFVSEIRRRHPEAPKPIIVGNCQGGWATMLLAAANPDITGPLVINGAPLAFWSGRIGENPMRYLGGLFGGTLPTLVLADLGYGEFDGAHLVTNFEMLNPGRNYFSKYYDLFANIDRDRATFLEFERWWGGLHFMNEPEIRWIVEQLFIGNRLSRGEARIERGRQLDIKAIRSPIIVFTSRGDNITPPQQALNWIVDTYADEHEIKIRGQRIIYMVHETTGHLGIFVSSTIAKKEHSEVASTMKTSEALSPGL
jgi:pimeloyl-ACP methyl ester carboxylesterase